MFGLGTFARVFAGGIAITNWSAISALVGGSQSDTILFSSCGMIRRNCVVDGDTFWLEEEKVRISNIDAPETFVPIAAKIRGSARTQVGATSS